MKIVKVPSNEVVVLYRVDRLYGWRRGGEYLPRGAETYATIVICDGEVNATIIEDDRQRRPVFSQVEDDLVIAFGKLLEKGLVDFDRWAALYPSDKPENLAGFVATAIGGRRVKLWQIEEDIDAYESSMRSNPGALEHLLVADALKESPLTVLKDHEDTIVRLLAALNGQWRYVILSGSEAASWLFWHVVLNKALPAAV
jgi:hypothetical protein